MRTTGFLTNVIVLLGVLNTSIAQSGRGRLFPRQESSQSTNLSLPPLSQPSESPGTTAEASSTVKKAASTSQASFSDGATGAATETVQPSHIATSKSSSTSHFSSTILLASSTAAPTANHARINGTISANEDPLPLRPSITPALSIAGVVLIGTGAVYTLIGIKSKWLHIFLATAYLTSLSVTVLIVYVMNPPIRDAIQGAYLVAAFFTGVIFGAGALIFQEVTEGFGCLLGGYCVAMWFLCLKPGGLLSGTSAKAIFIAVFTVATYTLSFSHLTRPYGLIGSTSFAGATAVVLGIDCFSRAGLKEFWLYLWALNGNLFPLDTNTYPITRGIRVEIASIIIIFLIGIVSQIKLWKVIKDRREKKTAIRLEDERRKEQMEERLGRRLEEGTNRERARWEVVYGEGPRQGTTDSGIGTEETEDSRKGSVSEVETREIPVVPKAMEMSTLYARGERSVKKRHSNIEENIGTAIPTIEISGSSATTDDEVPKTSQQRPIQRVSGSSVSSSNVGGSKPEATQSSVITVSPPPAVIPLPFTVPTEDVSDHDTDKASVATFGGSEDSPSEYAKRRSDRSIFKRVSGRSVKRESQSAEELIIPYENRSRASSVAATLDDDVSSRRSSLHGEPAEFDDERELPRDLEIQDAVEGPGKEASSVDDHATRRSSSTVTNTNAPPSPILDTNFPPANDSTLKLQGLSLSPSTSPPRWKAEDLNDNPKQTTPEANRDGPATENDDPEPAKTLAPQSEGVKLENYPSRAISSRSEARPSGQQTAEQLPNRVSKVVMSYRTNEWAKHLSDAEAPALDPLEQLEPEDELTGARVEAAAPVHVEELKQTALNAQPPPTSNEKVVQAQDGGTQSTPLSRSPSSISKASIEEQIRPTTTVRSSTLPSRTPSQISLNNGRSTPNLLHSSKVPSGLPSRGLRSSSTPFLSQTLATWPIEENVEAVYHPRNVVSPIIMTQRDTTTQIEHPYSALAPNSSSPAESALSLPSRNQSRTSINAPASLDDDNISLALRRELIQHQRPVSQGTTRLSTQISSFDSHQPQRAPSAVDPEKREVMLATWREGMRRDVALTTVPQASVEQRRADMLVEKQQNKMGKRQKEVERSFKEEAMDQAMRRGDMMIAHKEAMRRIQASANKHV